MATVTGWIMARPQYDELPSSPRDCDVILFVFDLASRP